jgi:phage gp36-like protein
MLDDVRTILARNAGSQIATAASLSDEQLTDAISEASDQIDASIGYTYPTPFQVPFPVQITHLARDIAAYLAYLNYRQFKDLNSALDPIYLRYQRAVQAIEDLRVGKSKLVDWPPPGDTVDQENPEGGTVLTPIVAGGVLFSPFDFDGRQAPRLDPFGVTGTGGGSYGVPGLWGQDPPGW